MIIFRMLVLAAWVGNLKFRKEVTDLVGRELAGVEFTDPSGLLRSIIARRLKFHFAEIVGVEVCTGFPL